MGTGSLLSATDLWFTHVTDTDAIDRSSRAKYMCFMTYQRYDRTIKVQQSKSADVFQTIFNSKLQNCLTNSLIIAKLMINVEWLTVRLKDVFTYNNTLVFVLQIYNSANSALTFFLSANHPLIRTFNHPFTHSPPGAEVKCFSQGHFGIWQEAQEIKPNKQWVLDNCSTPWATAAPV